MILVFPIPVFFPEWESGLRASDADRDRALEVLRSAVGDGRLSIAELNERLEPVLSARTLRELATLTADLADGSARQAMVSQRRDPESRWALLRSVLQRRRRSPTYPSLPVAAGQAPSTVSHRKTGGNNHHDKRHAYC